MSHGLRCLEKSGTITAFVASQLCRCNSSEDLVASAMPTEWRRPASVPLPTVWRKFKGVKAMPDGRVPNFWIQDVTPEWDDRIVDFMCDSFLKEENFCSITGVLKDPESLAAIRGMWKNMLQQRVALVAFSDWPNGEDEPTLAGCNVTGVEVKGHHLEEVPGVALKKVVGGLHAVEALVDPFDMYGVDAFMTALGLSVAVAFRGQELGRELLLAREPLARAVGLSLTVTVFTGAASQKQSARAGFQLLAEIKYKDYKDEDGKEVFPGAPCEVFQLKAKHFP